ncbi:hypothetical protein JL720_5417 [Aureococcus anophagefferens]|nr:hypothetical protein JL720_5417 [Aureococcus anophagefferens]
MDGRPDAVAAFDPNAGLDGTVGRLRRPPRRDRGPSTTRWPPATTASGSARPPARTCPATARLELKRPLRAPRDAAPPPLATTTRRRRARARGAGGADAGDARPAFAVAFLELDVSRRVLLDTRGRRAVAASAGRVRGSVGDVDASAADGGPAADAGAVPGCGTAAAARCATPLAPPALAGAARRWRPRRARGSAEAAAAAVGAARRAFEGEARGDGARAALAETAATRLRRRAFEADHGALSPSARHLADDAARLLEPARRSARAGLREDPRAPDYAPPLLQFMNEDCDFAMEHADGSFMDHLQFCSSTGRALPGESPNVLLLHSVHLLDFLPAADWRAEIDKDLFLMNFAALHALVAKGKLRHPAAIGRKEIAYSKAIGHDLPPLAAASRLPRDGTAARSPSKKPPPDF